jgi:hypothetical protein
MENIFKTTSFYLAAYLLAHDLVLMDYEHDKLNRVSFSFSDSDELIKRVNQFTLGSDDLVKASSLIESIKRLKGIIYDG